MQRRGAFSLALAAFWLASASPILAQGARWKGPTQPADPSHVLLPGGIGDRSAFEDELVNRLNRARDLAASERLLKRILENPKALDLDPEVLKKLANNIAKDVMRNPKRFNLPEDPEKLQELARKIQEKKLTPQEQRETFEKIAKGVNPNDPDFRALFRELDKKKKELPKLDKEALEAMRRRIGNFDPPPQRPVGPGPNVRPPVIPPMGQPENPMNPPGGQPPGGQPPVPPMPPERVQPPPPPPVAPPTEGGDNRSWLSRQLSKLRGSAGLGGVSRGFFRGLFGERLGLGRFGRGLSSRTSGLRSRLLPNFGGIRMKGFMGGMSKVMPRNLKLAPPPPGGLSSRGLGGAASGLGTGVLVVLLLGGAGVVLWLVLAGRRWVRGEAGRAWRLGPWPVTPATVQTRGDVVKAFEYLAMLLLGRRAVPANHLEIAGQLAANDLTGQRRMAAAELADLYEHARYAPPDENLSPDEMASARRDLSLLAGSSAA